MSREDGWSALHLEAPPRVPRTEYSAERHWALVREVTGIAVTEASDGAAQGAASAAFMRAWNYDFVWNTLIHNQVFGLKRTRMGHAEYETGGVDFVNEVAQLFDDPQEALGIDFDAMYGSPRPATLVTAFEDDYARRVSLCPTAVNMTGVYVTCMSGLIEILGWDTLLSAAGLDPDAFGAMATRYADWVSRYFTALAMSEVPVVMIHDDIVWSSGAFLHPDWYRRYLFPAMKRLVAPLREAGKKVIYTSDGSYTEFLDDIVGCGVHGLVMEPATDMALAAERYGRTQVLIGSADTRVLLANDPAAIEAEVKRCMDIGKGCPGFFMAVGNHIPSNTPVEAALRYNDCYLRMSRR